MQAKNKLQFTSFDSIFDGESVWLLQSCASDQVTWDNKAKHQYMPMKYVTQMIRFKVTLHLLSILLQ